MGGEKLKINRSLFKGFLILVLYCFSLSSIFAQADTSFGQDQTPFVSNYQDESRVILENPEDQVFFDNQRETSGLWPFIRMILVLAVVVACIYLVFFFIKRSRNPQNVNDAFLKKAATLVLSPGKSIHIITLLDKAYLVGSAENAINLLAEIQDKELVDTLNLNAEMESEHRAPDFASLLSLFMPKQKTTEDSDTESIFSDDSINTLKNQKNRLGKKLFDKDTGESL